MRHNDRVFWTVEASNGGNVVTQGTSDGITIDLTPPVPPAGGIVLGGGEQLDAVLPLFEPRVTASWDAFVDIESGVAATAARIRPCDSDGDVWITVGLANDFVASDLVLAEGVHYCVSVAVTNLAGITTEVMAAQSVVLDASPPVAVAVTIGTFASPVLHLRRTDTMSAMWWFEDPDGDALGLTGKYIT